MTFEEWWETYPAYERYTAAKDAWNAALEEAAKVCLEIQKDYLNHAEQARDGRYDFMADAAGVCHDEIHDLKAK